MRKYVVVQSKPKFLKSLNTRKQEEAFGQAVNSDFLCEICVSDSFKRLVQRGASLRNLGSKLTW